MGVPGGAAAAAQRQAGPQGAAGAGSRRQPAGLRRTGDGPGAATGGDLGGGTEAGAGRADRQLLRAGRRLDHLPAGGEPSSPGGYPVHPQGSVPAPDRARRGFGRTLRAGVSGRPGPGQRIDAADSGATALLRRGDSPAQSLEPVSVAGAGRFSRACSVERSVTGRRFPS
ncbi:Uncharacterised protein [Acinetobacter baumannii]|nr:Uncharacterised protein [Acinetobacter baumannii]